MRAAEAVEVEVRASRWLIGYLLGAHAAAILAVLASGLPKGPALAVSMLVAASLAATVLGLWRNGGLIGLRGARLGADGWQILSPHGAWSPARLRGESLVMPGLLILRFDSADGARRCLIAAPDSLDGETARRLRVALRTRGLRCQEK
jgi:toxin CptA